MSVNPFLPQIVCLPVKTISPYQRQLRRPKPKQADKAKRFLQEFGFVLPIVTDQAHSIVIGEVLFQAARALDYDTVPTIQIDHLDDAQIKALRVAYGRIEEDAEWDWTALKIEFEELQILIPEFDLSLTGFEIPEIDAILNLDIAADSDPLNTIPPIDEGNPPLGYKVENRQLLINDDEAPMAMHLFERYLVLGSVQKLKQELGRTNTLSPYRVSQRGTELGGARYSRGPLYAILKNPIYIGKIRHKNNIYDGQHKALLSEDVWQRVQDMLDKPVGAQTGQTKTRYRNLLQGLLLDTNCILYSPVHTKKDAKSYRYYISQNLLQYRDHPNGMMARLPAYEIEQAVITTMNQHITNPNLLADMLGLHDVKDHGVLNHITDSDIQIENLIRACVKRVRIGQDDLWIEIDLPNLRTYLHDTLNVSIPVRSEKSLHTLSNHFTTQRSYKGAIILKPDTPEKSLLDLPPVGLRNLVRGVIWRDRHFAGESMRAIARSEHLSEASVRKIIVNSFNTLLSL